MWYAKATTGRSPCSSAPCSSELGSRTLNADPRGRFLRQVNSLAWAAPQWSDPPDAQLIQDSLCGLRGIVDGIAVGVEGGARCARPARRTGLGVTCTRQGSAAR